MTDDKPSAVIELLRHVWRSQGQAGGGRSWERLNHAMSSALGLAVWSLFRFDRDDFIRIAKNFNIGYWGGNDRHMCGECFYSAACEGSHGANRSAAIAFERWVGRKAFILKEAKRSPSGRRLAIRSQFIWQGETVTVTSFSADGSFLTAVVRNYEHDERGSYRRCAVKRRFKVTWDALKELNKAVKAAEAER